MPRIITRMRATKRIKRRRIRTKRQKGSGGVFSRPIESLTLTAREDNAAINTSLQPIESPSLTTHEHNASINTNTYFDNTHIFVLAGHSGDSFGRYKLKMNEYYASPTQCGRSATNVDNGFINFIKHNQHIKVPNSSYTLNYNNFPFKTSVSTLANSLNNKQIVENNWKIYKPQSTFQKTNSIPNFNFLYFDRHPVKIQIVELKNNFEFTYNGKTDVLTPGKYMLSIVGLSGVLQPNTWTDDFDREYNTLMSTSNIIKNDIFDTRFVGVNENYLFIMYPIKEWESDLYNSQKSYALYFKDVINLVSKLSFIDYKKYIDLNKPSLKLKDVFDLSISSDKLFSDIRTKLGDEKSIFILNPLCRGTSLSTILKTVAISGLPLLTSPFTGLSLIPATAATGVGAKAYFTPLRKYFSRKNAEESNNEANNTSFLRGSRRANLREERKSKKRSGYLGLLGM